MKLSRYVLLREDRDEEPRCCCEILSARGSYDTSPWANLRGVAVSTAIAALLFVQALAVEASPVSLPSFVVTEMPESAPWRYARVADFEVLTLCPEDFTQRFVEAHYRGHLFLPAFFQSRRTEPTQITLYSGKNEIPETARMTSSNMARWGAVGGRTWRSFPGVLVNTDAEQLSIAANFIHYTHYESVTAYYAAQRLLSCTPSAPLWLREGLFGNRGVFPGVQGIQAYNQSNIIRLPRLEWFDGDRFPTNSRSGLQLMPLAEFFGAAATAGADPTRYRNWCLQAGLFVHWALYGQRDLPTAAKAFWAFAHQSQQQPVTESLFQQHFGLNYREAEDKLYWHLIEFLDRTLEVAVPTLHDPLPEFEHFKLRPATEGEIARLKGNFERLEAARLRADFPDLAAKYDAAARRTLQRGLKLSGGDPQVRAVLGLLESDTGHPAEARPHLEAAFAAKVASTRGLLTLARLRLADMRIGLPPEGKLPSEALDRVLTPLFAARERQPASADVYLAIADVWAQSALTPTKQHLAVLLEGSELFPENAELLWRAAELHQRHGYSAEAAALAAQGEKVARDPALRTKFTRLRSQLRD